MRYYEANITLGYFIQRVFIIIIRDILFLLVVVFIVLVCLLMLAIVIDSITSIYFTRSPRL
jgi:lipopolysaccharide/colanic/teichoic acid biosynthesis glycosyltransferase